MVSTYSRPRPDFKKRRPSKAQPDMSLSIQEIVRRYVKGIPVDVVKREPVYVDQTEFDLERLSRMDFAEKAEFAEALAAQNDQTIRDLQEAERSRSEARAKAEREASERAKAPEKQGPSPAA